MTVVSWAGMSDDSVIMAVVGVGVGLLAVLVTRLLTLAAGIGGELGHVRGEVGDMRRDVSEVRRDLRDLGERVTRDRGCVDRGAVGLN